MTASQKLRQLYEGAQAYYDGDVSQEAVIAVNTYVDTLAENGALIASVVEAAEEVMVLVQKNVPGPEAFGGRLGNVRAALTALEEALGGDVT